MFTAAVVVVGSFCVLFDRLSLANVSFAGIGVSVPLYMGTVAVCLSHLAYLGVVTSTVIFIPPLEKLRIQDVVLPVCLLFAYVAAAIPQLLVHKYQIEEGLVASLELISYGAFACLYVLWFSRDYFERVDLQLPGKRAEKRKWILLDLILFLFLIVVIAAKLARLQITAPPFLDKMITAKDISVGGCLILWLVIQFSDSQSKQTGYSDLYRNYKRFNCISANSSYPVSISGDASFLDFGCADGQRLGELFEICGIDDSKIAKITGYDIDETWQGGFEDSQVHPSEKIFVSKVGALNASEYNAFHFSHVLYEPRVVATAINLLTNARTNSVVFIRGSSPNSFFALCSKALSARLWSPPLTHLWNSVYLMDVADKAKLKRVDPTKTGITPDLVIEQSYTLNHDSIDKASRLLEYLYGRTAGENAAITMKSLLDTGNCKSIPNHDLLYVYLKE
jgi:hypothetical protein